MPNEQKDRAIADQLFQIAAQLERIGQSMVDDRLKLYNYLARERAQIAAKYGVKPAYVATNEALYNMLVKMPKSLGGLRRVHGIGRNRITKYGQDLLDALHRVVDMGA